MIDVYLVPEGTKVSAKGDGAPVDILGMTNRVLLLTLTIAGIVEQESIEVSIFGSANGEAWSEKPVASFPQKFYRGDHPLLLNLNEHPEVKMLRAHWEVGRWGRGEATPMFEFHLRAREVPAEMVGAPRTAMAARG
ncbi:MAG: hypothetical protein ACRD3E_20285 [Terriglobales bacterium]